jgi:hypothetical protein
MDDKADKPKSRWPTYLAVVLVLVFVVYPLSIGPMLVLTLRLDAKAFNRCYRAFYYPLSFTAKSTGTNDLLFAYATWWTEVTKTRRPPR